MYEPTQDETMKVALGDKGMQPAGAQNVTIFALAGRQSKCPDPNRVKPFALVFSEMSPYAVGEILEFTDAQQQRYWTAYEVTKRVQRDLKIYGHTPIESAEALLVDELETGWPKMQLGYIYDIVRMIVTKLDKGPDVPMTTLPETARDAITKVINTFTLETNKYSWMGVLGRLGSLMRLKIFDHPTAQPLDLRQ
jgi:hypothetical protein